MRSSIIEISAIAPCMAGPVADEDEWCVRGEPRAFEVRLMSRNRKCSHRVVAGDGYSKAVLADVLGLGHPRRDSARIRCASQRCVSRSNLRTPGSPGRSIWRATCSCRRTSASSARSWVRRSSSMSVTAPPRPPVCLRGYCSPSDWTGGRGTDQDWRHGSGPSWAAARVRLASIARPGRGMTRRPLLGQANLPFQSEHAVRASTGDPYSFLELGRVNRPERLLGHPRLPRLLGMPVTDHPLRWQPRSRPGLEPRSPGAVRGLPHQGAGPLATHRLDLTSMSPAEVCVGIMTCWLGGLPVGQRAGWARRFAGVRLGAEGASGGET